MGYSDDIKNRVISLRKQGKTYSEIRGRVKLVIPKSTLFSWCKDIILTPKQKLRIKQIMLKNTQKGRMAALAANKRKREKHLQDINNQIQHLSVILKNKDVAKVVLSIFYLSEGSKKQKGSLMFGNSDPVIISMFLKLLRDCYQIDESKFRCTVQCRADQNIPYLEKYWSNITKISLNNFYKARVDMRTLGKPTKKYNYKGVCRIDYFSADIFIELRQIIQVIYAGL